MRMGKEILNFLPNKVEYRVDANSLLYAEKQSDVIFRVVIFKAIMCYNFQKHNMRFYICLWNKSGYIHRHIIICVVCSSTRICKTCCQTSVRVPLATVAQ